MDSVFISQPPDAQPRARPPRVPGRERPFSGRAYPFVADPQSQLGDRLRHVFRTFPLTHMHPGMGYAKEVREEGERESNMAVSRHRVVAGQQPVGTRSEAASLAQLVDMMLDRGVVIEGWARVSIDAWARVSVLGLELLTIEVRMVVTSAETYLHYADAMARLTPAAPPPWQRSVSGGESEHDRVLEGEMLRALSEHSEALPPASA